jgi:hypothetical protein
MKQLVQRGMLALAITGVLMGREPARGGVLVVPHAPTDGPCGGAACTLPHDPPDTPRCGLPTAPAPLSCWVRATE